MSSPAVRRRAAPKKVYGRKQTTAAQLFFDIATDNVGNSSTKTKEDLDDVSQQLESLVIDDKGARQRSADNGAEKNTPKIKTILGEKDHNQPLVIATPINAKKAQVSILSISKDVSEDESTVDIKTASPILLRRSPRKAKAAAAITVQEIFGTKPIRQSSRPPTSKQQSTPEPEAISIEPKTAAYIAPILSEAVSKSAKRLQNFDTWLSKFSSKFDVVKIAEGSYGEVFQMRMKPLAELRAAINAEDKLPLKARSRLAKLRGHDGCILKIVPLRAMAGAGSRKNTSVEEIVSETQLMKLLDPIPGFARFRELHLVQGRFPEELQQSWWEYQENNEDCFNPDPSKKGSYPDKQLWAVLEMDNAGRELEKFKCQSVNQAWDVFWGVALGLARAEQEVRFEHRDLHLGNVCILLPNADESESGYHKTSSNRAYGKSGIKTAIIDYSLSRADMLLDPSLSTSPSDTSIRIASSDLDKRKIFDAIGQDEEEAELRDTYRKMRTAVYKTQGHDPNSTKTKKMKSELRERVWSEYTPVTNLIWLGFLMGCLRRQVKGLEDEDLDGLMEVMGEVQDVIEALVEVEANEGQIEEGSAVPCAGVLIRWACENGWLGEEDFAG